MQKSEPGLVYLDALSKQFAVILDVLLSQTGEKRGSVVLFIPKGRASNLDRETAYLC
jgi:hypothetical protein